MPSRDRARAAAQGAEAAVLIGRGRADAAVEALRRASQYELGTVAALLPVYLRAELAALPLVHTGTR